MSFESNLELLWFCFTMLFVWVKKDSPHHPKQSDAKRKLIVTWSRAFSRAWCWFSHWFIVLVTITVITLVLF